MISFWIRHAFREYEILFGHYNPRVGPHTLFKKCFGKERFGKERFGKERFGKERFRKKRFGEVLPSHCLRRSS